MNVGRFDEALADYSHTIELDETYANAFGGRGLIYYLMENYESAITELVRATELEPQNSIFYQLLGKAYDKLQQYDNALEAYKHYLELIGDNVDQSIVDRIQQLETFTP